MVLFADWLTTAVVEREVTSGGGAGKVKVVLCGHRWVRRAPHMAAYYATWRLTMACSMGGLLAADSLRGFFDTRPDSSSPLWPRIIACLAFDTPVGIGPYRFSAHPSS